MLNQSRIALFFAALILSASATASSFSISPIPFPPFFAGGPTAHTLEVVNKGTEPLTLEAAAFTWEGKPTREIRFFPPIAKLKPGEGQKIKVWRITSIDESEKAYRLVVRELAPPLQAGIVSLPSASLSLFLTPKDAAHKLQVEKIEKTGGKRTVTLANKGSAHIRIMGVRSGDGAEILPYGRFSDVLAGESMRLEVPADCHSLLVKDDQNHEMPLAL